MSAWSWTSAYRCLDRILLTPEISILSELFPFLREKSPLLFCTASALLPLMGSHPVSLCQFDSLSRRPTGPDGTGILLGPRPVCICRRSWIAIIPDHFRPFALRSDLSHYAPSEPLFPLLSCSLLLNTPSCPDLSIFLTSSVFSLPTTSPLSMHSAGVSWLCPRCIPPMSPLFFSSRSRLATRSSRRICR